MSTTDGIPGSSSRNTQTLVPSLDIEHTLVTDDPRTWPPLRKITALAIVSSGSFISGLATSIYNPGIAAIKSELQASDDEISLSLSIYIILSGICPLLWSSVSELYGRKPVYLVSMTLALVGCIVAAEAKSMPVLIGMRCIQAAGTSSMLAVGAGTLADIYDSHERGSKLGIYYAAPMLGPSFGPLLGGVLTQYLGWRSTFWFLAIWTGVTVIGFIWPFRETFRKERSATYQKALTKRKAAAHTKRHLLPAPTSPSSNPTSPISPTQERKPTANAPVEHEAPSTHDLAHTQSRKSTADELREVRLSLADLNPAPPMLLILRRWTNLAILVPSGIVFGFSYSLQYTATLTLERAYHLSALDVGLVLLAYGCGSILGSVGGGRFSDYCYARGVTCMASISKSRDEEEEAPAAATATVTATAATETETKSKSAAPLKPAESRLRTPLYTLPFLPFLVATYGWLAQTHQPLSALIIILFSNGLANMWTYAALTSYLVDANTGSASIAAAANSLFRGVAAFVASEACVPVRAAIGEGGLYSVWAGVWVIGAGCVLCVFLCGREARGRWM